MKKIIIVLFIGTGLLYSQWKPITTGIEYGLYSVQFFDTLTGIAAGNNGIIIKTTNGGDTWEPYLNFVNLYPDFFTVSLYDTSGGWIAGRSGSLLHTSNKGLSWEQKTGFMFTVGGFWLSHAVFMNEDVGWMLGSYNALFRTKFGDNYWTVEYVTREATHFNYMFTKDCISGYLVGDGGIAVRTTDYGINWEILPTNVTQKLENVTFINDSIGWIVGGMGTILKTTNGGSSWSKYDHERTDQYNWISFVNDTVGWIVGVNGAILNTVNAGQTWETIPSGTTSSLRSIYFMDEHHGIIVGQSGTILQYDTTYVLGLTDGSDIPVPLNFEVTQNYPNPFNPATTITFSIPHDEFVQLTVFDVLGKEVKKLIDQPYEAGRYSIEFDASLLTSGTYFYRLTAGNNSATHKMVLLK